MAETVTNIHVGYVNLKDNARAHIGNVVHIHQPEDRCLPDLRSTDPRDDKARIEAIKGGLLEDSYRWILDHGDFQQWRNDKSNRLLWIRGDPGKGKTMLLCGIVNELSPGTKLKDQNANALHVLSYFFCQAADERINSATAVLRGLIYLIVDQKPELVSHIQKKYKHVGDALFKDVNAWTALSEIFLNILEDIDASLQQTYIVIDALDECVTDLPKLLDFITLKSAPFSHLKWIVSSRNWPDIEEHFNSATQQIINLCLELNGNSISAAVSAYIKHQVEWLAQKKQYDERTKDIVQQHLSSNSNNTFLWVALVCQNLEKISLQNNALQKLNEFPPGLNSLYKRMMQQIHKLEDVSDVKFCCQILATVLHVYRPITLTELGILIKCPDADLIHKAIGFCGSFLTVRDSQVYMIHQSAKDYLSNKAVSHTFLPSPADVHGVILSQSVQAMSATLRRNIYNLYSPSLPINEIKTPDPDPLEVIRYSCAYWIDHFCAIYDNDGQSQNQVDDEKCQMVSLFFRKYFLYWLEALGLLGHIEDSVLSIIRLGNLLKGQLSNKQFQQPTQGPRQAHSLRLKFKTLLIGNLSDRQSPNCHMQLLELTQDAQRFIWRNSSLIANSPLQVYISALVFSPLNSLIRTIFQKEEPKWLNTPTVEYNWSPYLQTLHGHNHWVRSVAFSPDGQYLASASENKIIKIWDATTGKEQQTLRGHTRSIASLAFSPDGHYLASGSDDKTIKIWDTATGKEQQTIQDGLGCLITSVAFSPDGRYLASGLDDKLIKVWDVATGKNLQTLRGHAYSVTSVAFSPNNKYLASGSEDKTIKIWDAKTGKEDQTLQGHSHSVSSIAFSPDSSYIASASKDKTTRIWPVMMIGKEHQILQGHNHSVTSVAFSPDGRYLASGSDDKTIKVWDITTGKTRQTLQGHSRAVTSIAFSAGNYLASGSDDTTVKIWDITGKDWDIADKEQQTPRMQSGSITSIAFSVDGRYLASGSDDMTVRIWDNRGTKPQILRGHSDWVRSVAFSADGRYLASASDDKTVKIWDRTGKERQTLQGHHLSVTSVAFSADGRYLASGSDDNTVKIWDMTGKERRTIQGESRVTSIAFSYDGRYLASGLSNKTIIIWDIAGNKQQTLQGHSLSVTSVAFSLDGRYLASGSNDKTIKIWDITTGKEQQTILIGTEIHAISIGNTTSYLHTEVGLIKLGIEYCNEVKSTMAAQVLSTHPDRHQGQDQRQSLADNAQKATHFHVGYGLSTDKCWITWNGHNIVWLPPDYKPSISAIWGCTPRNITSPQVSSTDVVIALGNDSGRVTVIRMSGSGPPLL